MEKITTKQILRSIGKIYDEAKESGLKNSLFESIKPELKILASYFKSSETQTFFIAIVFARNYAGRLTGLDDLISYIGCNPMTLLVDFLQIL